MLLKEHAAEPEGKMAGTTDQDRPDETGTEGADADRPLPLCRHI